VSERGRAASDVAAEQTIVGSMMTSRLAFDEVTSRGGLSGVEFYQPRHQVIFTVMVDLADAGTPVEPTTVLAELTDRKELAKVGGAAYLHQLMTMASPGSAGFHADRVKLLYRTRRAAQLAERIIQIADEVSPDELQDALAATAIELDLIVDETDGRAIEGLSNWRDFMSVAPDPSDWVVPGLLERQEVVMILGASGIGKSWLSRQFALCVAAGLHPFKFTRIDPKRTLLVDLENPASTLRRQSEAVFLQAERLGVPIGNRGHLWTFPEGFNLRKRADAMQLESVVADIRPDVLCLGSLYNAYQRGRDDWDHVAEDVKAVFNRIRQRYGCAVWLEHHMPKKQGGGHTESPFGSSVWERWVMYGRVLKMVNDEVFELAATFRGDRDANRDFPPGLRRGGEFPWTPIWDAAELDYLRNGKH